MSETSKYRNLFLKYCTSDKNGLDIGYGGDPIIDTAICLDLPSRYSFEGNKPQHIKGDAKDLSIFSDNSLDWIYSSHCIEDFEDTKAVLIEWIRVLKPNGYLCLLFPDEQVYRERSNTHNIFHKHLDFGLGFIKNIINTIDNVEIEEARELFENNDYNCIVVIRKLSE